MDMGFPFAGWFCRSKHNRCTYTDGASTYRRWRRSGTPAPDTRKEPAHGMAGQPHTAGPQGSHILRTGVALCPRLADHGKPAARESGSRDGGLEPVRSLTDHDGPFVTLLVPPGLDGVAAQLARIGTNVNQIAHAVNIRRRAEYA